MRQQRLRLFWRGLGWSIEDLWGVAVRAHARIGMALGGALLLGAGGFLVWQLGVPAYERSQPVPVLSADEVLALPEQVYEPSPYVRSTQAMGPPGPVGLVLGGREAREGFTGMVSDPWYVVSARTGAYSRLAAPHLQEMRVLPSLSPDGTRIAWSWPGGIEVYDTMSGQTRSYSGPSGAAETLVWSPDSTRIAFGSDPVRMLDTETGDVVDLALPAPSGSEVTPAWTADGRWLSLAVEDAIEAVEVETGERRTLPTGVGGLRSAAWNSEGALAGLASGATGVALRVVRAPGVEGPDAPARVVATARPGLVIDDLWGWSGSGEVVLTGLRPQSGGLEQAMVFSVTDGTLRPLMQLPARGGNFAGTSTMSVAGDVLQQPTRDYAKQRAPWSPGAKLILCMLVAVFPMVYFLVARRPKR